MTSLHFIPSPFFLAFTPSIADLSTLDFMFRFSAFVWRFDVFFLLE